MKVGVPYPDAMKMPEAFAFALLKSLSNGRQKNTRSNNQEPSIQGKRRVATRRKSQESKE